MKLAHPIPPTPVTVWPLARCSLCLELGRVVVLCAARGNSVCACRACLADVVGIFIGNNVSAVEQWLVETTVDAANGNKTRAARTLGLHRRSLYRRLRSTGRRA
jgi:transcriptional regulator of acetoin/glycerol metabolism